MKVHDNDKLMEIFPLHNQPAALGSHRVPNSLFKPMTRFERFVPLQAEDTLWVASLLAGWYLFFIVRLVTIVFRSVHGLALWAGATSSFSRMADAAISALGLGCWPLLAFLGSTDSPTGG